jgi:hypothetical protein
MAVEVGVLFEIDLLTNYGLNRGKYTKNIHDFKDIQNSMTSIQHVQKLIWVLNNENKEILYLLGKFIFQNSINVLYFLIYAAVCVLMK